MACKKVSVRSHKRCFCSGKLAKNSRCGLKTGTKKRKATKRKSAKAACLPGTLKMRRLKKVGKRCMCKTRGGGTKFVKTSKCK